MHDILLEVIPIVGALLTGLLVAWATFRVARQERSDQRLRDLENAMADFLSAITKAVGFIRQMPHLDERHPAVVLSTLSGKIKDKLSPGWTFVSSQRRMREVMGPEPMLPAERVVDAGARLKVLDPGPELAAAVEACLDYVIVLGSDRTAEQLERWTEIHKQLLEAIAATRTRASSGVL